MKSKLIYLCYLLGFALLSGVLQTPANAQYLAPDKNNQPYINWISQYPVHKEGEDKKNALRKIYEFLVQKNKSKSVKRPVALFATSPSDFWTLDQGGQTIFRIQNNKAEVPRSIRKKDNYFTSLVGICLMPSGNILFTDSRLNKVFELDNEENKLSSFVDTLTLEQPTGIAYCAPTEEVWVVETNAHRISIFNKNGSLVKRIGTRGDEHGQFNFPTSIWIDKAGDAYIVDAMNFRVQIFNKKGEFLSTFGEAGDGTGFFARPKGIATDSYGNIYVADALFHVVQIFNRAGNFLYSFGKQGREKEEFWMPSGLFIDKNNYIYVADSYNSRVQVFQLINGS
jgi:sugar lactone lactonase YvrE